MFKLVLISSAMGNGFPFAFCPHPHDCAWDRLDEDAVHSRDRALAVSEDDLDQADRAVEGTRRLDPRAGDPLDGLG